jgi:hypothetical protein
VLSREVLAVGDLAEGAHVALGNLTARSAVALDHGPRHGWGKISITSTPRLTREPARKIAEKSVE